MLVQEADLASACNMSREWRDDNWNLFGFVG